MKDMNETLARTPELIEGIIEIAHQRKWLETSIAAIKFSQCVIQGLWSGSSSLEQLPHLAESEIRDITSAPTKTTKAQAKTLGEYLRVPNDDKKGLDTLSAEEREDVLKVCALIPDLKIETRLYVEEEEQDFLGDEDDTAAAKNVVAISGDDIYENDLVTLRVTLTRQNITDIKGKAAPVHAPLFPKTIRENWWIILTDRPSKNVNAMGKVPEPNIHAFEKVSNQAREVTHEIRFMAPPKVGTYEMELQVLSDCYLGLDEVIPLEFTVKPASELPEYAPHPEDKDLDNEPTLFEQVMAANLDESSDEEEDEEEEKKFLDGPTETKSSGAVAKKGVVVEDVEDSEEED